MKFIFFGAGYCSRFLIPLLPMGTEIICTHNEAIKQQENDKLYSLKRLKLKDFLKKKIFIWKMYHVFLIRFRPYKMEI